MKRYISALRQEINLSFQHRVAAVYRAVATDVSENVNKFGPLRLVRSKGNDIGDIDVLVIDERAKVMVAVEVKDFELARTPAELSTEIAKLLTGEKSAVRRHEERLTFLREHFAQVHAVLKLPGAPRDWQMRGQVVTSRNLLASQFSIGRERAKRLNIFHFGELAQLADAGVLTRRTPDSTSVRKRKRKKRR